MQGKIKILRGMKSTLPLVEETMPREVYQEALRTGDSRNRKLFGYFVTGELVGCSGYLQVGQVYWISWTAVTAVFQRKGIGQALLDRVFEELRKKKVKKVSVMTYENPSFFSAISFYLKNGFRLSEFDRDAMEDGSSILYYTKEL
uniref:Putative acetyltransferase n=1 Tax=viral metagenome TaxID=1070528 RepID=A0A6M3LFC1_9ZZZZ